MFLSAACGGCVLWIIPRQRRHHSLDELEVPIILPREACPVVEHGKLTDRRRIGKGRLDEIDDGSGRDLEVSDGRVEAPASGDEQRAACDVAAAQLDLSLCELGDESVGDRHGDVGRAPVDVRLEHLEGFWQVELASHEEVAQRLRVVIKRVRGCDLRRSRVENIERDGVAVCRISRTALVARCRSGSLASFGSISARACQALELILHLIEVRCDLRGGRILPQLLLHHSRSLGREWHSDE